MGDPIMGTGILLQVGDGAAPVESFVSIAQIVSLKPMQLSRNEVDGSVHNTGLEKKLLGILRCGQVTGTLNWLPLDPTHSRSVGLMADIFNNTKRNYRIPVPPNPPGLPVLEFAGQVQLIDPQEVAMDALLQVAFALTVDLETLDIHEDET